MSRSQYEQGFIDGMTAYAINRDGQQIVGNERPLRECIAKVRDTWNFSPPKDTANDLVEVLYMCMGEMVHAFNRIHCLPRTTDTVLANNIDHALGKARAAIAKARGTP